VVKEEVEKEEGKAMVKKVKVGYWIKYLVWFKVDLRTSWTISPPAPPPER